MACGGRSRVGRPSEVEATCERRQGTRQPVRRARLASPVSRTSPNRALQICQWQNGTCECEFERISDRESVSGRQRCIEIRPVASGFRPGDRVHLPVSSGYRPSRWVGGRLRKSDSTTDAGSTTGRPTTNAGFDSVRRTDNGRLIDVGRRPTADDPTTGSGCYDRSRGTTMDPTTASVRASPPLRVDRGRQDDSPADASRHRSVPHLWTRPLPPPSISASTSATPTRWKSPEIECFRQPAAVAKSRALLSSA